MGSGFLGESGNIILSVFQKVSMYVYIVFSGKDSKYDIK